ncbi:MAG: peptidase M28 [Gammaproteobacteria bacterium RBG_16_51_14]|nr:MAG: peptidase M28 [Gammaproteobacteria bacterium RBG_16_51_14]
MYRYRSLFVPVIATWLLAAPSPSFCQIHHELKVVLVPDTHKISVVDTITLPEKRNGPVRFQLHHGLNPEVQGVGAEISQLPEQQTGRASDMDPALRSRGIPLESYIVHLAAGVYQFTLRYAGPIFHPIEQQGEEYARSFPVSPGIVSSEGSFLAGSSYWYPFFEDRLMTFSMEVELPAGWRAITQGRRTQRADQVARITETWVSDQPQEEIYLVAGALTEYLETTDGIDAMVMLRQPEPELARKYLEATVRYLQMYQQLLGPYPYPKFALVENFWETGYGMPSFTLLGSKVIRLPFILHSSYPHEILHNWWGNSVYVDFDSGNWSEGLTSYLADHLIKEQQGEGSEYRRATLQKYTDYVREHQDFPLSEFRGRHDSVTEAVGYGKTMMLFHMLRRELGDATFTEALRRFYQRYQFTVAGFDDLASVFSEVGGHSLAAFFEQWVQRSGAPALRVYGAEATPGKESGGYILTAVIEQIQAGPPCRLILPIAVHMQGTAEAFQTSVVMDSKEYLLRLDVPARPLRLDIDPEFDVFRRLDRNEIPPAISQAFGAEQALLVLPADAPPVIRKGYADLASAWQQGRTAQIEIGYDNEITELPGDRAIWLFGWENRFRPVIISVLADHDFTDAGNELRVRGEELSRAKNSVVVLARHPSNPEYALAWVAADNVKAMPGLERKLPHYGKYSYLGFSGDEPDNVIKGQWPVIHSPMSVPVQQNDGLEVTDTPAKLKPRSALIPPPAIFSAQRMRDDITYLAKEEMEGRGLGSTQLEHAANFIANVFRAAGLQPGGDTPTSYFQSWYVRIRDDPDQIALRNVVGVLPGTNPDWKDQSIVIGAHYDHLGHGWPDVYKGEEGKIHPGADDNASGVAVMLELARTLGDQWQPQRTIQFVAFTGEEASRLGSTHYVQASKGGHEKIIAMLNLDTIGRLGARELLVMGSGSAREWEPVFRGAGYVTGVPVKPIRDDIGSSDQKSFLDAGIPAVQLFAGPHPDYHRPTDTVDKIDTEGLVKTAAVVKEVLEYLASRPEPLSQTPSDQNAVIRDQPETRLSQQGRRVSLGTVPDYAYTGKGVKLSGVGPDTPAVKAGLREGDIIIRLNDTRVDNLRDFSDALRILQPGDAVVVHIVRDGMELSISMNVIAR